MRKKSSKTYFVTADIHSYYTEMVKALVEAGFDHHNKDHVLIICGDLFDRGSESKELLDFLFSIPKDQLILIKGNHEDLLERIFTNKTIYNCDYTNGTLKTIMDLTGFDLFFFPDKIKDAEKILKSKKVFKLIKSMKDYYEIGDYIFVHGWIPYSEDNPNPNWRNASSEDWKKARWLNGMEQFFNGFYEDGKTIVCGHFHTSWGHVRKENSNINNDENFTKSIFTKSEFSKLEFSENANFDIFEDESKTNAKIIALDACTAYTHKVNVLKITI